MQNLPRISKQFQPMQRIPTKTPTVQKPCIDRANPDFSGLHNKKERQIVRFGVLSLCRKAAAHFLHTVCTFARIGGFSAQGLSLWMTTPNCWHCCVSSCAAQATPNDVPRNTNCYKTARPPGSRRPCRFVRYFAKSGNFPRPHSATLTGRTYTPSAA